MESYGALLREAREEKKIALETIERETSISKEFLQALEEEDTSVFHGEAYLIGFLKSYSDYLDLDSKKIVNLYRNVMIQESPVPEGLIEKPRTSFLNSYFVIGIISVLLIAIGIISFSVYRQKQIEKENAYAVSEKIQQKVYELTDKPINTRVYVGDQIIIPSKAGNVVLTVASDVDSKLGITTPIGLQYFELSETRELDIDGDAISDFVLDVWEISSDEKSRGAEVYIVKRDESLSSEITDNTSIPVKQNVTSEHFVILEDNRSYPFTVNALFRKPCVFRYEVDRKNSVENYYDNGDVINMSPNNKVRIWMSNGNTVKLQVIAASQSYELEIAKAGECVVEDIKWILSDDGKYKLVVEPIE